MDKKSLEKTLSQILQILGPYSNEIVVGGGIALLIYRYFLSGAAKNLSIPAATDDLDLLIPRKMELARLEPLSIRLENAGFTRITRSIETPPVESYHATIGGLEMTLEFLTDRRSRENQNMNVVVSGVSAQPLSYIEMSQQHSAPFSISTREKGKVVSPEAWIFHKALTFSRRLSENKRVKDLYGIWYVGSQLSDLSIKALKDLRELAKSYPKNWTRTARKQIDGWLTEASPRNWELLQSQDPAGKLTRELFMKFIDEDLPF